MLLMYTIFPQFRTSLIAFRLARTTENVRTKCIIFGEALRNRVKKFKQILPENYSKNTKIAITACKFSKIYWVSMPPDPPLVFPVSQSAFNLLCRKKIRLKHVEIMAPPPFEISRYATA